MYNNWNLKWNIFNLSNWSFIIVSILNKWIYIINLNIKKILNSSNHALSQKVSYFNSLLYIYRLKRIPLNNLIMETNLIIFVM